MKRVVKLLGVFVGVALCLMCSIVAFAGIGAEPNGQMTDPTADPTFTAAQPMTSVPSDLEAIPGMNDDSRAIVPQYIDPAMKSAQMMTAPAYPMMPNMNTQAVSPYSSAPVQMMPSQPSYMQNTAPNYMMPVPTMPGMDSNMYSPYGVQPQFQPSQQQFQAPQYGSADMSYNQAMQAYRMRDYWTAMSKFQEVATMYPQSDLADNAYYWIGEIYYASRNYAEAIRSFQTVMQMYPNGNKLPDAMVKMGFAYAEMQQYDVARTILNDVTMRFGNDARIRDLAAKKLQQLPMMTY